MKQLLKDSEEIINFSSPLIKDPFFAFLSWSLSDFLFLFPSLASVLSPFLLKPPLSSSSLEHKIPQRHPEEETPLLDNTPMGDFTLWRYKSHSTHLLSCLNPLTHTHTHLDMMTKHHRLISHSHWPRSEHWTTLSRQWQPKGHMGMSGEGISSTAEPSSSSLIIVISPPLSMLSMAKSQKPLCSNGRAEEVESSRATHSSSRREQCGNILTLYTWENTNRKQFYCTWVFTLWVASLLGTTS